MNIDVLKDDRNVHFHLLYGCILWDEPTKANKVSKCQKAAIWILVGTNYDQLCMPPIYLARSVLPLPRIY